MTSPATVATRQDTCQAVRPLTCRQQQVVSLAALGLTNRAVGARLAITENTVKDAMRLIMANLAVSSRAAAVAKAGQRGLLLPAEQLPTRPVIRLRAARPHRVSVVDLRDVLARWENQAPAELLDELRDLLGPVAS